jgi:hypothetical protein
MQPERKAHVTQLANNTDDREAIPTLNTDDY